MAQDSPSCEFCRIAHGLENAQIVCETDECLSFFPLSPVVAGHTLVIPKAHIPDFWSADATTLPAITYAVRKTGLAVMVALNPDGMNIINSAGQAASQTVYHLHIHIVPRWHGDRMGDIWPPSPTITTGELDETAERVRSECGRAK